jgi:hypothetical protein
MSGRFAGGASAPKAGGVTVSYPERLEMVAVGEARGSSAACVLLRPLLSYLRFEPLFIFLFFVYIYTLPISFVSQPNLGF